LAPRDLVYVGHMLDMAKKATNKTQGLSRGEYDADENLRLALTHLIQIIGPPPSTDAGKERSATHADERERNHHFEHGLAVALSSKETAEIGCVPSAGSRLGSTLSDLANRFLEPRCPARADTGRRPLRRCGQGRSSS
jgi:hypothetical protein